MLNSKKDRSAIGRTIIQRICSMLMVLLLTLGAIPDVTAAHFSDVPSSHWAYHAIDYVSENHYMDGGGNNLFDPNGKITKAQILTLLHSLAGDPTPTNSQPYGDVSSGSYYYVPVCWAYYHDLTQIIQVSASTLSPHSQVTRVKIAELIWKFAQVMEWTDGSVPSITLPYNDVGGLTTTQINALKWCFYNQIMVGSGGGFSPYSTLTRAEQAMLTYAVDRFATKNRAFCVGTNFNDSWGTDTSGAAINAGEFYEARGYMVNCEIAPTVNIMRDKHNIKSQVLFLYGHANYNCIVFNYMQNGGDWKTGVYYGGNLNNDSTGYKYVGINGNMEFVNLAVFAGCQTAKGTDNIASRAVAKGAKVSIGWTKEVITVSETAWLNFFNLRLKFGYTISDAIDYADSVTPYLPFSNVLNHTVYSSNSADFNENSTLSDGGQQQTDYNTQDQNKKRQCPYENVNIPGEDVIGEIAEIIRNTNPEFKAENYNTYIIENGRRSVIQFVRRIKGFETDSVYTAIVSDGKLTSLQNNTYEFSEDTESRLCEISNRLGIVDAQAPESFIDVVDGVIVLPENVSEELAYALQLALEETQADAQKEATHVRYQYFYNAENGEACILVLTTYCYDGTEAKGVDMFTYVIPE